MSDQALAREQQRAKEAEEELAALKKQIITMRGLYDKERELNDQHKKIISQLSQQAKANNRIPEVKRFDQEKELQNKLTESQQHGKQLERVIQFLRERAEESHLEAKQLREEFQAKCALTDTLKKQFDENEQELKMAQQQLGKKMKEVTLLSEKNEELYKALDEQQTQYANLEQEHSSLMFRERQLQEQLQNSSQVTEAQIKKWEEKYQQAYDKWQEAETQVRHFKSMEEKYQQASAALANLSSILGPHSASAAASVKNVFHHLEEPRTQPAPPVEPIQTHAISSKNDLNAPQMRFKQSLFD